MTDTRCAVAGAAERLPVLLAEQRAIIEQLAELAASQSRLIDGVQTDALLELLSKRQGLIERFTALQPAIAALLDDIEPHVDSLEPALREHIRADIDVIAVRLEQVMAVDAEDQRRLESHRDDAREEVSASDRARVARTAYRNVASSGARFTDRNG